mgnify:CR=1 FL=1
MRVLVIPDTQVSPGVPTDHLTDIGRAICEYLPDYVVHLGDHWDMKSLNRWVPRGGLEIEGTRILKDLEAGNTALHKITNPIHAFNKRRKKKYKPKLHFIMGNHEERLLRYVRENSCLEGVFGPHSFDLEGWTVHPFLHLFNIQEVYFTHYFANPNSGRPYAGTAHSKLRNVGLSMVMGHQQGLDLAIRMLPNGQQQRCIVAGSCYAHREIYRGPQGHENFQGVLILNDLKGSSYDLMELSLRYLKKKFR